MHGVRVKESESNCSEGGKNVGLVNVYVAFGSSVVGYKDFEITEIMWQNEMEL